MTRTGAAVATVLLFLLLGLPVVGTWRGFRSAATKAAATQTGIVANQAARRLEEYTRSRMLILEAVCKDVRGGSAPEREKFLAYTANLQEEFGGFQAINWIDASGEIQWVSPLAGNESAIGRNVFEHPVAGELLRAAGETRRPYMTPPLTLFQGGRAFTTYYPVSRPDGSPAGYVNGVFLIDKLVRGALSDGVLDRFDVAITDEGEPVFGSSEVVAQGGTERVSGESFVELLGRRWRMRVAPTESTWSAMRGDPQLAFLLGGIALAAALSLLTWGALFRGIQRREAREEKRLLGIRLEQTRKLEAIGQLAGGVAHDFNNMITAILGNAGLARRSGAGGPAAERFLRRIEEACGRASELTTQLLTFSRNQIVEEKPLDLAREIERQRALFAPIVRDDVRLVASLDPGTGVVLLSPGSVSQLLTNLLANAVQAMPEGGELRLSSRPESRNPRGEPGPWAVLSVRDDGVGMSEAVKARAVEPFYTTKPLGEGTGLGLSTVFVIATRAGGSVEIESAPGMGTTVEIWLPATDEAAESAAEPAPARSDLQGTVLLVEDEPSVLEATAELLQQSGLRVIKARDGREAREVAAGGAEFDVVVTDAVMAHVGGLDLLRGLRESGVRVGAVICSGYSGDLSRSDLEAVDAVFVPKPYSVETLLEAIEERMRSFDPREA